MLDLEGYVNGNIVQTIANAGTGGGSYERDGNQNATYDTVSYPHPALSQPQTCFFAEDPAALLEFTDRKEFTFIIRFGNNTAACSALSFYRAALLDNTIVRLSGGQISCGCSEGATTLTVPVASSALGSSYQVAVRGDGVNLDLFGGDEMQDMASTTIEDGFFENTEFRCGSIDNAEHAFGIQALVFDESLTDTQIQLYTDLMVAFFGASTGH